MCVSEYCGKYKKYKNTFGHTVMRFKESVATAAAWPHVITAYINKRVSCFYIGIKVLYRH